MNVVPVIRTEDLTVEEFDWGTLTWLCNGKLSPRAQQTLGICTILPGCKNPVHYHPNCEEILYMLAGTGVHSYNDQQIELSTGMTLRIPSGVLHNFRNTGDEPIRCIITFSSGQRETVFLE